MTLKNFLDSNPIAILVGVGLAVASTTAGIMNHMTEQRVDNEKTKIELELKTENSALKLRLSSIERKVGAGEDTSFDVSRLILSSDRVRELDTTYKSIADGIFFVAEPKMDSWKYSLTSELELIRASLEGGNSDEMLNQLANALGKKNLHLWQNSETIVVFPPPRKGLEGIAPKKMKFFSYAAVQIMSKEEFTGAITEFEKALSNQSEIELKKLDVLLKDADDLLKKKERIPVTQEQKIPPNAGDANASHSLPDETVSKLERASDAKLQKEELLADLFQGDLAAVLLGGLVTQTLQTPRAFSDTKAKLITVQKKGNVLYLQARIEFKSVEIEGKAGKTPFFLDQEFFVVTNPQEMFVVKIQVPSTDGRSEAFTWVSQWLSGLRIPLNRV